MLGSKVSDFIKKRYLIAPDGEGSDTGKEISDESVKGDEPSLDEVSEVVELDKEFLDYEKSNQGRSYGWWILINGQRVASLEFRCLLEYPVYLYCAVLLDDRFLEIDLIPEKWSHPNVMFQSRYAEEYIKKGLVMASVGQKMIVADDLVLPEDVFRKRHKELVEFHLKLLNNTK
jgi:hypothetical protein